MPNTVNSDGSINHGGVQTPSNPSQLNPTDPGYTPGNADANNPINSGINDQYATITGAIRAANEKRIAGLNSQAAGEIQGAQDFGQQSSQFADAQLGRIGGFEGSYRISLQNSIANRTEKNIRAINMAKEEAIGRGDVEMELKLGELGLQQMKLMADLSQRQFENDLSTKKFLQDNSQFNITEKRLSGQQAAQNVDWGVIRQEMDPNTFELKNVYGWIDKTTKTAVPGGGDSYSSTPPKSSGFGGSVGSSPAPAGGFRTDRNSNPIALSVSLDKNGNIDTKDPYNKEWLAAIKGIPYTVGDTFDGGKRATLRFPDENIGQAAAGVLLATSAFNWYKNHTGREALAGVNSAQDYARLGANERAQIVRGIYNAENGSMAGTQRFLGDQQQPTNNQQAAKQNTGNPILDSVIANPSILSTFPAQKQMIIRGQLEKQGIQINTTGYEEGDIKNLVDSILVRKRELKDLPKDQQTLVSKYMAQNGLTPPRTFTIAQKDIQPQAITGYLAVLNVEQMLQQDPDLLSKALTGNKYIDSLFGAGAFSSSMKEVADIKTRIRTGAALNNQEIAFYDSQLPNAFDKPEQVQKKLNLFKAFYLGSSGAPVTLQNPNTGEQKTLTDMYDPKERALMNKYLIQGNYSVVEQ